MTTSPDALTHLFMHNRWANVRLAKFCAGLPRESLAASIPGSFGSIHVTLQHIATSERSYLARISTGEPYAGPRNDELMPIESILELFQTTGSSLIDWCNKVHADEVVTVNWDGTPLPVHKVVILTQAIHHGGEHREQIKAVLTELGIEPPDLQSWAYFEEQLRQDSTSG
jgi:uncharacterized damage-inducible protein DinB